MSDLMKLPTGTNIALFTNPRHEIWMGETTPSAKEIQDLIPKPGEALVHVCATTICASDIHCWKDGHLGDLVVPEKHILGHESAGMVLKVGEGVSNIKPGDKVSIEPGSFCGYCTRCTGGFYNGCVAAKCKSVPPVPGQIRRYMTHQAHLLYPIGDLSYETGALLEPLSVGLAAVERANILVGDPVIIGGAGPIGIICAMVAHTNGASPIVITDLDAGRLEAAKKLVPSIRTVQVSKDEDSKVTSERVKKAANGLLMKAGIECSGFESSVNAVIYSLDFRAILVLAGMGQNFIQFPFMHVITSEIDIKPIFKYKNTWPRAIRAVQNGLIDVVPLITHRFELSQAVEAFNTFGDTKKGALKIMIKDYDDVDVK